MKKLVDAVTWVVLIVGFGMVIVYHLEIANWLNRHLPANRNLAWLGAHWWQVAVIIAAISIILWGMTRFDRRRSHNRPATHRRQTMETWLRVNKIF